MPFLFYFKTVNFLLENPLTGLAIIALVILVFYFLTRILPRLLIGAEKNSMEKLSEADSHSLDNEQNYLQYFDPSYPTEAYETTMDFVPIDSGWNYGEKKMYDFITAKPEAEEDEVLGETDFEKSGSDRRMFE